MKRLWIDNLPVRNTRVMMAIFVSADVLKAVVVFRSKSEGKITLLNLLFEAE
jgi:hypothetical protein